MSASPSQGQRLLASFAWMAAGIISLLVLSAIWLQALGSAADGLTTSTGARDAAFVLVMAYAVGLFVRRFRVWAPSALALVAAGISIAFVSLAGFLFGTGRLNAAWSLYGGLQILRSDKLWADQFWILSWFECDQCSAWDPHYGPALAWLEPLTGGAIGLAWLPLTGILISLGAAAAIFLLARDARPLGRVLIVVAAVSPAWLLLLDRANSDAIVLSGIVLSLFIATRHSKIWTWSLAAAVIWILGTVKFFPFAMGLALLGALTLKRGWVVVLGFLSASIAYVVIAWDSYRRSSTWNSSEILVIEDFPAYGRIQVMERLRGDVLGELLPTFGVAALVAIVVMATVWGWIAMPPSVNARKGMWWGTLALAGSAAFLGKVMWGGFAFMYAGAFLLMVLPLMGTRNRSRGQDSIGLATVAVLALVALFAAYNTALATLAGFIVAGYGLGAGARQLLGVWDRESARGSLVKPSAAAPTSFL